MHVVPLHNVHPRMVKSMAELAADLDLGPQANPFPEESDQFAEWNRVYYARVQRNAVECAS